MRRRALAPQTLRTLLLGVSGLWGCDDGAATSERADAQPERCVPPVDCGPGRRCLPEGEGGWRCVPDEEASGQGSMDADLPGVDAGLDGDALAPSGDADIVEDAAPSRDDAGPPEDAGAPPPAPWPGPCAIVERGPDLGDGVTHRWQMRYQRGLLVESVLDLYEDGEPDYRLTQTWSGGRLVEVVADFSADGRPDHRERLTYEGDLHVATDIASTGGEIDTRERLSYDPVEPVARLVGSTVDVGLDGVIDEEMFIEYDLAGRERGRRWDLLADGSIERSERVVYDRLSRRVRLEESGAAGVERISIWLYEGDSPWPSARRVDTDADGVPDYIERWERDARGNPTERREDRQANGQIGLIATYDYSCWDVEDATE